MGAGQLRLKGTLCGTGGGGRGWWDGLIRGVASFQGHCIDLKIRTLNRLLCS